MKTVFVALSLTVLVGCSKVDVNPGHEVVLVNKPWFFAHGGVESEAVKNGSVFTAWSTDAYDISMLPVTFDEDFDDMMPKDNNPVTFQAHVRVQATDSVKLYSKYGVDIYNQNVKRVFQNLIRNQVRQYSMPELALQQEVVIQVESVLETELREYLKREDIPIKVLNITLGKISPHREIIAAYNETGVQQQRSKTEHQRKLAEDARREAEVSRAVADKAYQDTLGLTTFQFIELQQIKMCGEKQNCSVFLGASAPKPVVPVVGRLEK